MTPPNVILRPASPDDIDGWLHRNECIPVHSCGMQLRWTGVKAICDQCCTAWRYEVLIQYTPEEISERFFVMEWERTAEERLVWITTENVEYAGTIVRSSLSDVAGTLQDGRAWRAWDYT